MAGVERNCTSQLSPQERSVILAMLEEYTNALVIYHNTLEKPAKDVNDIAECILFDTEYVRYTNAPDDIARIEELKGQAVSAKLHEDSLYLQKIMEDLKDEVREKGTFEVLTKEVERLIAQEKEEETLRLETERLEKLAAELKKTIAEEKIANEEEKKRILNALAEEKRDIEKLKLIADAELDYVTAWEAARYEQNAARADMEIEKLEKILNECRTREKNEERVHNQRTMFLTRDIKSFEEKTREWEERYVREKEMHEKKIRQLRIEIAARRKELEELTEEYHHKQEFIDTCLTEKEALRKETEQKERERSGAIRIQAWWRGVMVRRKLGPYRPEEKKKRRAKTKK
ncbi:IQ domain-containing protein G [Dufourea novaeangliae]|uniref:Dynein regulatory complex protein 9 n=1 Tax=Dufourea novaeangliae TaxID=178035 RepID=A0A154PKB0_DUFNO|nr:IQ domain-containing protein G [Dufourea novaeangliae]